MEFFVRIVFSCIDHKLTAQTIRQNNIENCFDFSESEKNLEDIITEYILISLYKCWGSHCRDRMVVGFTTTYAISTYHHQSCEFESRLWQSVLDTTLCDKDC